MPRDCEAILRGALGRNRTYDARLRTAALYPLSYKRIYYNLWRYGDSNPTPLPPAQNAATPAYFFVEIRRIELLLPACHAGVLPLNYIPETISRQMGAMEALYQMSYIPFCFLYRIYIIFMLVNYFLNFIFYYIILLCICQVIFPLLFHVEH